ncbi:MAG: tRNA (guanosine(46)-N7)-methyltransferase TrmB [Proteobacteria bacterium]|nr:tRNA (guanosine(46)-N7)-methyltransferase TrmB [Pseudomonadota bacterium]
MQQELRNFQNNRLIRSFGRIKSRKLSDHKNHLLENLFPLYEIKNFESAAQKNCLEIGFGFGDFIFEKAKKNPDTFFFGSEPHLNGVVNLLAKLEVEPLKNLKISTSDVRLLLNKFPDKFFDQIFILFPDPWPKSKHFKRRLISQEFLDEILSPKIKARSNLTIATDHDSYKTWILCEIDRSQKFFWNANSKKDWQVFPNDWVVTKYQKKAAREGRSSVIFNLIHNV